MFAATVGAAEKTTLGAVEDIILLPWGLKLAARIDTGAAMSSLDVCEYSVKGKYVTFTLPDRCGGPRSRLPFRGWLYIQSSNGGERRPVVEVRICLGPRRFRTRVTLADRSHMEFPFLVGRNTLKKGNFVVDARRLRAAEPGCPEEMSP